MHTNYDRNLFNIDYKVLGFGLMDLKSEFVKNL